MNLLIKIIISFLFLGIIFYHFDIKKVSQSLVSIEITFFIFAIVFQFISTIVASYRWFLLMEIIHYQQNYLFFLKSYLKATFFNQALPTSIGGDAMRALDISKLGGKKREAFYSVLIDRIVGLSGLLLLNFVAILFAHNLLTYPIYYLLNATIGTIIFFLFVLGFLHKIKTLKENKIGRVLRQISIRYANIFSRLRYIISQHFLAIITHICTMVAIYLLAKSVGLKLDFIVFLVLVPPVILLTLIPISLAGWGVREGAMVALFTLVAANNEKVISMSILYGVVLLLISLIGFVVMLKQKHKMF
jgi:glycosyltransferase 2 family protein